MKLLIIVIMSFVYLKVNAQENIPCYDDSAQIESFDPKVDEGYFFPILAPSEFEIKIYNRWGILVHQSDKNDGWDGKDLNKKKVDASTYYFMVKINCGNNDEYTKTGYFTINENNK